MKYYQLHELKDKILEQERLNINDIELYHNNRVNFKHSIDTENDHNAVGYATLLIDLFALLGKNLHLMTDDARLFYLRNSFLRNNEEAVEQYLAKLLTQAKQWEQLNKEERQHSLELLYACSLGYSTIHFEQQLVVKEIIEVLSSMQMGSDSDLFYKAKWVPSLSELQWKLESPKRGNPLTEAQELEALQELESYSIKMPLISSEPYFAYKTQFNAFESTFQAAFHPSSEWRLYQQILCIPDEQVVPEKMLSKFRIAQRHSIFDKENAFKRAEELTKVEQKYDDNTLPAAKKNAEETKKLLNNSKAEVYNSIHSRAWTISCCVPSFLSLMASTGISSYFGASIQYTMAIGASVSGTAVLLTKSAADYLFMRGENKARWPKVLSFCIGSILGAGLGYPTTISMDYLRHVASSLTAAQPIANLSLEAIASGKIPLLDSSTIILLLNCSMLLSVGSFVYGFSIETTKSRGII